MKRRVVLRKKARRILKKADKGARERILIALLKLAGDPYLGRPLLGELKGKFSLRLWPYRIIYEVSGSRLAILDIASCLTVYGN
jgi:mRNA-degrading endonuclease RelE of RelBE toxin-antitoxin system